MFESCKPIYNHHGKVRKYFVEECPNHFTYWQLSVCPSSTYCSGLLYRDGARTRTDWRLENHFLRTLTASGSGYFIPYFFSCTLLWLGQISSRKQIIKIYQGFSLLDFHFMPDSAEFNLLK